MIIDTDTCGVHGQSLVDRADGRAAAHSEGLRLHGGRGGEGEGDDEFLCGGSGVSSLIGARLRRGVMGLGRDETAGYCGF